MSFIDGRLGMDIRSTYVNEIRTWLPAFLSASAIERLNPLEQVQELLNIEPGDLHRILAVHVLRQDAVQDFIAALPAAMRAPATTSHNPRHVARVVTGGIDWAATLRMRSGGNVLDHGFVTRPAARLFDVAENRVLSWTLAELARLSNLALQALPAETGADWHGQLRRGQAVVAEARRSAWLRSVRSSRPTPYDFSTLSTSRRRFYRLELANAAKVVRRYVEAPTPADITELLVQRWFEPERDWLLFELTVLLRLERKFASCAHRDRVRFLGAAGKAFASYHLDQDAAIRIWYQTWPPASLPSELRDAMQHYGMSGSGSRPDIVIEVSKPDGSYGILLELKATRSTQYLSAGLLQLLGYIRDRPGLFDREQSAWLVAPSEASFKRVNAGGRGLWVVGADWVAEAAASHIGQLLGA